MEGYEHLLDATDERGVNIANVAEKKNLKKVLEALQEASVYEVCHSRDFCFRCIFLSDCLVLYIQETKNSTTER